MTYHLNHMSCVFWKCGQTDIARLRHKSVWILKKFDSRATSVGALFSQSSDNFECAVGASTVYDMDEVLFCRPSLGYQGSEATLDVFRLLKGRNHGYNKRFSHLTRPLLLTCRL
jgi:hypothetical protein